MSVSAWIGVFLRAVVGRAAESRLGLGLPATEATVHYTALGNYPLLARLLPKIYDFWPAGFGRFGALFGPIRPLPRPWLGAQGHCASDGPGLGSVGGFQTPFRADFRFGIWAIWALTVRVGCSCVFAMD